MVIELELRQSLRKATSLAIDLAERRITIRGFISQYNDFYYDRALDGHEADEEEKKYLSKYGNLILFHERVQTEIVDLVYLGNDDRMAEFLAAGRIDPTTAADRLIALTKQFDLSDWLQRLDNSTTVPNKNSSGMKTE